MTFVYLLINRLVSVWIVVKDPISFFVCCVFDKVFCFVIFETLFRRFSFLFVSIECVVNKALGRFGFGERRWLGF